MIFWILLIFAKILKFPGDRLELLPSVFLLANSEDPDQTSRSVASDLGLHYMFMSQKWDARLICVNIDSKDAGKFDPGFETAREQFNCSLHNCYHTTSALGDDDYRYM